jgi:hypothetical protein
VCLPRLSEWSPEKDDREIGDALVSLHQTSIYKISAVSRLRISNL